MAEHARARLAPPAAAELAARRDERGRGDRGRRQQRQRYGVFRYKQIEPRSNKMGWK